jgi:PrgI family protein
MARTHEVPNHLNVQDTLFLGLSARQVATFIAFASPAYGIWDQLSIVPVVARGALAALVLLAGLAFTFIQPGGRALEEWAFAIFAFAVTPRRLRWSRPEVDPRVWSVGGSSGWADLAPSLAWNGVAVGPHHDREDDDEQ